VPLPEGFVIEPLPHAEQRAMTISTARQAIAVAQSRYAPLANAMTATAVFGSLTVAQTLKPAFPPRQDAGLRWREIKDRPAWIVTFTYAHPIDFAALHDDPLATGPTRPDLRDHLDIVLDAGSGAFLIGFSTK
jgi:hypothetical protein